MKPVITFVLAVGLGVLGMNVIAQDLTPKSPQPRPQHLSTLVQPHPPAPKPQRMDTGRSMERHQPLQTDCQTANLVHGMGWTAHRSCIAVVTNETKQIMKNQVKGKNAVRDKTHLLDG